MVLIFDIVLIAVIVSIILYYSKKGIISASKNIITIILTIVLLTSMQGVVLDMIRSTTLGDSIKQRVSESVTKVYEEKNLPENADTTDSDTALEICESMALPSFLSKNIEKSLGQMTEVKNNVMEVITDTLTMLIMRIIALILLFVMVRVFVFLIVKFAESLFELPVLKSINRTLGVIMGIVNALIFIYIVCGLVSLFVPADKLVDVTEMINQTVVLKHFYNNNLLFGLFM